MITNGQDLVREKIGGAWRFRRSGFLHGDATTMLLQLESCGSYDFVVIPFER